MSNFPRAPWGAPLVVFGAALLFLAAMVIPARAQQKTEISVSRAFGIIYMVGHVVEKKHLIEKHAERLGVPGLKVNWVNFSGGGVQTDALLAGQVDIVNSGIGNLLVLWDRTKGGVKGIVGTAGHPLLLITRDPAIQSIKDIKPSDRIAVPTVKVSTHAMLLQMEAAKLYGPDQWARFDANTVQLGHPEAVQAMMNPQHELKTHFSAPPYDQLELKSVPGARVLLTSEDILGSPIAQAQFFTTTKFADANPKVVEALKAAVIEAIDFIRNDTRGAIEIYREINKDKATTEELLEVMKQPGMMSFTATPQGTMKLATHLHRIGTLRTLPKAWTDYYLPVAHDLKGD